MDGAKVSPPSLPPVPPARTRLPVVSAPPDTTGKIEGTVVSYDSASHTVRIETGRGYVDIKTASPPPVDTAVILDIRLQKAQLVADIAVLRQADKMAQEIQHATAPLPLQSGADYTAIRLPHAPQPEAAADIPVTLEKIAAILAQISVDVLLQAPFPPPLQTAVIADILAAPDKEKALQQLPQAAQQAVLSWFAQPKIAAFFTATVPQTQTQEQAQIQPQIRAPQDAQVDQNLFHIIRAQLSAKVTQSMINPSGTQPHTADTAAALWPLLENLMQDSGKDTLSGHVLRDNITRMAAGIENISNHLPKNMHVISVISTHAPDADVPHISGTQQHGVIEGLTPSGFPILKTLDGGEDTFILKADTQTTVGTHVIFDSKPMTPEQIIGNLLPSAASPSVGFHPLRDFVWPALNDMTLHVQHAAPAIAAQVQSSIPAAATPQKIAPAALFFLAALRTGLIENWLGDKTMDILRQSGKRDLIEKLAGDFGRLSAQSKSTVAGEWRAISLPFMHDENISQLQFFIRQQPDDKQEQDESGAPQKPVTRFILNLQLSRMGDMQLDGLLFRKRLDLIVRTHEKLPFAIRQDIMQAFARGMDETQMQGSVSFQEKRDKWVEIDTRPPATQDVQA